MQILGLQIDGFCLRAALLQKEGLGFKVCTLKSVSLTESEPVKLLYKDKFKGRFVSGLSSKDLILRSIELNLGKARYMQAALAFQAEGATCLNPADVISIAYNIKKKASRIEALLFTVSRETLKDRIETFEKLQIDLDCMSAYSLGLLHYIKWKSPSLSDAFIVDCGSNEWTCVLMEKGELRKSHAISSGTKELLATLWEDLENPPQKGVHLIEEIAKQMDLRQTTSESHPHFFAKLSAMRQELSKTIFAFHRIANQQPIVFTGHVNVFNHLRAYLLEDFREAISKEYDENLDLEERMYAIPIGLAIEQTEKSLQLLSQEFFPLKKWRSAGFYALILFFFSICLSASLLCIGINIINARKKTIFESVQPLISMWDPKLKSQLLQNEEIALEQWLSAIEEGDKEYPYILDVPRVAEVLFWLDRHPLLQAFKKEEDPLEVRSLRYQLVEYPRIGASQNRYRAKVDLQFRVKSPMNARRFHEALFKGDDIVDPSSEVTWEVVNNSYRAAFFLKRSKVYVP